MTQQPHWYSKKIRHNQLVASQKDQRMNTPKNDRIEWKCGSITNETYNELLRWDSLKRSLDRNCCRKSKVAYIKVQTSDKELSYNLCMKHFDLDFIRKRQIVWRGTSCN